MERIYKTTIVLVTLMICVTARTQVVTSDLESKYPFINFAADSIVYNKNSVKIKAFFQKVGAVATTKKGSVNIVHIV